MRIYEVNPANTSEIWGEDLDGIQYFSGTRPGGGLWRLHNGRQVSRINDTGIPEWDLYLAIMDNTPTPAYHTLDRIDLTFEGVVNNPAARVRETRVYAQISIDDLYDAKIEELLSHDTLVRYNAVDTALAANWWIVATERARSELYGIGINWNLRQHKSQGWPGGANAPRIAIYNANNQNIRREQPTQAQFEQMFQELSLHDQDTSAATKNCGDTMEAQYNARNWTALAIIDPTDGSWGYPPFVELRGVQAALL